MIGKKAPGGYTIGLGPQQLVERIGFDDFFDIPGTCLSFVLGIEPSKRRPKLQNKVHWSFQKRFHGNENQLLLFHVVRDGFF